MKTNSSRVKPLILIVLLVCSLTVKSQSDLEHFFKYKGVSLLAKLAHPTNTYESGTYNIQGNEIYIEINYTNSKMSLLLRKDGTYVTNIDAQDDDWLPPFFAIEMIKDFIVETAFDSEDKNKVISTLEKYFKTTLIKMSGEQIACVAMTLSLQSYRNEENIQFAPKFRKYISSETPYWYDEWVGYVQESDFYGDEGDGDKLSKGAKIFRLTLKHLEKMDECITDKVSTRPDLKEKLRTKSQFLDFLDNRLGAYNSCSEEIKDFFDSRNLDTEEYLFEPYASALDNYLVNTIHFRRQVYLNLDYSASSTEVNRLIEKYKDVVLREFINTTAYMAKEPE